MNAEVIRTDVCVIGDGAVGKAAALGLAQSGMRVVLLSDAGQSKSASLNLSPGALVQSEAIWDVRVFALNQVAHALLDQLKVWGALDAARVAEVREMKVMDASNPTQAKAGELHFDAYAAYMDELAWIVEDRNLNTALDSALRFASNLQRVEGRSVAFTYEPDVACLSLASGTRIEASLMVGADGAQSWLRSQCDIGLDYRSYYQQGVVSNFACELPHHGVAYQWFVQEQGIIALLPLAGNRVSLVWSAPDALAAQLLQEPLAQLAQRLAVYAQPVLGQLTPLQPELVKAFPLRLMRPHAMIAPRVALVGDAAHVVHPLAGHGMNLGFADVRDLLQVIGDREAFRDCGDDRVLRRYQRSRREEVALMQWTTDGLARLFGSEIPAVRLLRNQGLNLVNQLSVLKRGLISHAMGKIN